MEPLLGAPTESRERNWVALGVSAVLIVGVIVAGLLIGRRSRTVPAITPVNAVADDYAAKLPLTGIVMSESGNLAGGKVTYIDGHIANHGDQTVIGVTVQVIFHSYTHEIAQNETLALNLIRTRDPYIDTESVAAAPLKPGSEQDFRLIFDTVSPDWDGAYPEVRVLRVVTR
jgi:hypothetical protein